MRSLLGSSCGRISGWALSALVLGLGQPVILDLVVQRSPVDFKQMCGVGNVPSGIVKYFQYVLFLYPLQA